MSKESAIYDRLLEVIQEEFPEMIELPDPYDLTNNADQELTNGWGLRVGGSTYEEYTFCQRLANRSFTIILSKENVTLSSSTDELRRVSKVFIDDVAAIQKQIYNYNDLEIEAVIAALEMGETSPILKVSEEKSNFLYVEIDFVFKVTEAI